MHRHVRSSEGLTLIETAISALVALVLAGAVMSVGHAILSADRASAEAWRGSELAIGLLEEISSQPFDDPTLGESTIGPDAGEWPAASHPAVDFSAPRTNMRRRPDRVPG